MSSPAPFMTVYGVYQQNPHLRMTHTQTGLTGETPAILLQAFVHKTDAEDYKAMLLADTPDYPVEVRPIPVY